MFIFTDKKSEAEATIAALTQIGCYGINLNKNKTLIMTDRQNMADCKEINGKTIRDHIKYLEVTIYCDRQKIPTSPKKKSQVIFGLLKRPDPNKQPD